MRIPPGTRRTPISARAHLQLGGTLVPRSTRLWLILLRHYSLGLRALVMVETTLTRTDIRDHLNTTENNCILKRKIYWIVFSTYTFFYIYEIILLGNQLAEHQSWRVAYELSLERLVLAMNHSANSSTHPSTAKLWLWIYPIPYPTHQNQIQIHLKVPLKSGRCKLTGSKWRNWEAETYWEER